MYCLIFKSRKPEAKAFKRWVTHEVLPAIRKTGSYGQLPISIPGNDTRDYWATGRIASMLGIQYHTLAGWLETHGMLRREGYCYMPTDKAATKYSGAFVLLQNIYVKWTPQMAQLIMQRYREFSQREPKLLEGGAG